MRHNQKNAMISLHLEMINQSLALNWTVHARIVPAGVHHFNELCNIQTTIHKARTEGKFVYQLHC